MCVLGLVRAAVFDAGFTNAHYGAPRLVWATLAGIASGKSEASRHLRRLGVPIVDAGEPNASSH